MPGPYRLTGIERASKFDKVGVYGGANIGAVTLFMDGYALGVDHYNQMSGSDVKVLGWNPDTRSGSPALTSRNRPKTAARG